MIESAPPTSIAHKDRDTVLDGLRGVAAFAVMIFHGGQVFHAKHHPFAQAPLAVDFFFALSGYVLAYAYEDRLIAKRLSFVRFFTRRLIRLCPMLLLGSAIGAAVFAVSGGLPRHDLPALLLLGVFALPAWKLFLGWSLFPLDPPAWSLCVEVAANVIYGAAVRHLRTAGALALIGLSWLALLFFALTFNSIGSGLPGGLLIQGLARAIFAFFTGVVIWRARGSLPCFRVTPWALGLLLLVAFWPNPVAHAGLYELAFVTLLSPMILAAGAKAQALGRTGYVFEWLGRLSYPVYAVHFPVFVALKLTPLVYRGSLAIMLGAGLSTAIALASLIIYDEPIRSWLGRWAAARGKIPPA